MAKLVVLAFIMLMLSGCNTSATSAPTPLVPVIETPTQRDLMPIERTLEPIEISTTPTVTAHMQASQSPTEHPTATSVASSPTSSSIPFQPLFSFPIGTPGKPLGDGFFIRHGAQVENTWYNPGYWHTGEDWYAIEGDTAGAGVYAIADGEVVYAGANYPGRVVIVQHADDLYSMYGHLDPALAVRSGQRVVRGELIGTVLRRGDATPNHLHFEIRTFLTAEEINGSAPRYGFRCGRNCPPGPGYWPINAPDVPNEVGWRNPIHLIARHILSEGAISEVVVASQPLSGSVMLWSAPPDDAAREALGELELHPGERFTLLEVRAGPEDTRQTSALAYLLWYRIQLPDGRAGWVQAAVPSTFETGSDGHPSSVYFNFLPAAV